MKYTIQVAIYHKAFQGYGPDGDPTTDNPAYTYILDDLPEEYRVLAEDEPHVGCFRVNNNVDGTGGWEGGWEFPGVFNTRSLSVDDVVELRFYNEDDLLGFDPGQGEFLFDHYPLKAIKWKVLPIGWKTIDNFPQTVDV